jgi:hypothetical protein
MAWLSCAASEPKLVVAASTRVLLGLCCSPVVAACCLVACAGPLQKGVLCPDLYPMTVTDNACGHCCVCALRT